MFIFVVFVVVSDKQRIKLGDEKTREINNKNKIR